MGGGKGEHVSLLLSIQDADLVLGRFLKTLFPGGQRISPVFITCISALIIFNGSLDRSSPT